MKRNKVHIIGAPMDLGQGRRGVDMGPSAIRYSELNGRLASLGLQVNDCGNLDIPVPEEAPNTIESGMRHLPVVSAVNRELALQTYAAMEAGAIPLTLGGDHSIAAGSVVGVRRHGRVGLVWIDAHADFNTPATSPSGNLHGMPLAALCGFEPYGLAPWDMDSKGEPTMKLRPQEVALIGVRSVDPEERRALIDVGLKVYTMRDIDELGVAEITRQVLNHFWRLGLDRLHVSFDPDSLDPDIAPGVGTPVPGGLTYREAHLLMEMLADDERVCSADIVEINPILDHRNHTAVLSVQLIASLLGQAII